MFFKSVLLSLKTSTEMHDLASYVEQVKSQTEKGQ